MTEKTCENRARGDGGVLRCTQDPDHEPGIHSSGEWFWNHGDTEATRGDPAELVTVACVRCGAMPLTDDWGEITGWVDAADEQCEHSLVPAS